MKRIILSAIYLFVSILTFAQTNPVKVADFFADFEIKPYNGNVMDTVYNTGVNVTLPVFVRFKLKGAYGSGNFFMVPQRSYASIMYEHANGFDFNPLPISIDLSKNEWRPMTGSMYSPYVKVDLTLYKEYLKSGKLKTYYMSEYDAVNRGWQNRLETNYKRNITVVQVPNFIGPSQICDAATYTIERPDVVTLENASGVATLTALGNNQWKVTNIGGAGVAKTIKLRSASQGKTFDKDIIIGGGYATAVEGPSNGHGGEMFEFTMEYIGQGTIKWKCNSNLVDMSFGDTGPNLLIGTAELLHNQKNKQVLIEGIFTSSCGVVTQINKTLTLNP
ncbi:hypothetical protein QE382_002290 [Sphingobacterium zeae]|uniref:Uncharacterized protein n=1 Tax=Sphingobacterium zeae TaxID=1776859 RepID=A0ABU0U5R3_9SPHI|nr:hypothetical protein [Sphingobacterium zeae]MDQ1150306.1 hypothetical protein [Sphingobacterium zeae]